MIEVLKQMQEALEWCHGGEPIGTAEAIKAGKKLIAELESQEPVAFKCGDAMVHIKPPIYGNTHPPQRTEQETVECDGDFPEGFDKSLDIPAQALRQANAALCEVTNNRMWDVPALAERMLMFCRNTHPPQRTEQNFCSRCGKRTNDIHTCTPPQENT